MLADTVYASTVGEDLDILLDGAPVSLPPGRRSLSGIRSYLETLALEQQRVLCCVRVDGAAAGSSGRFNNSDRFTRVEGKTADLDEIPLQLIRLALNQADDARSKVQSAVPLILINDAVLARELWWKLTKGLKLPLMTLSLLPEPRSGAPTGGASPMQLRKWQLQQLGGILKEVDDACWALNSAVLAHALESRVLPWLDNLQISLELLLATASAGWSAAEQQPDQDPTGGHPMHF